MLLAALAAPAEVEMLVAASSVVAGALVVSGTLVLSTAAVVDSADVVGGLLVVVAVEGRDVLVAEVTPVDPIK